MIVVVIMVTFHKYFRGEVVHFLSIHINFSLLPSHMKKITYFSIVKTHSVTLSDSTRDIPLLQRYSPPGILILSPAIRGFSISSVIVLDFLQMKYAF